ncbi:MAG: efflux RND transporter periplasmic adaptor subunit [Anaerolineaceae bacterium]|nr:efflux RND transporter periplasmic adaptor subunit [Anaerolineaceae bacterium]
MKRKTWIIIIAVLGIAAALFFYFSSQKNGAGAQSAFQTVALERGNLTALVGATGTVRANQTALLAWQTSGRIERIHRKLGETVTARNVLAELEQSSLPQSVILARADLVSARRALEDVKSSETAIARAQLALAQAEKALDQAVKNRDRKQYHRASASSLDTARANYILAQNTFDQAEDFYSGVADRGENDPLRASALSQLGAARQRRDQALANLNYLLGLPDLQEVAEAEAQVELATAQLEDARREWERLKDGKDVEDIAAAEARVAALEATLAMARLEAPINGTLTETRSNPGDQVSPGTVSFRIDDLTHLVVDLEVPEVDINRVRLEQPVILSFDAIPGREYHGVVSEVARVGAITQGTVNFGVKIELTDWDAEVLPGMTAAVNITVKKLEDVLLLPNRAVRLRDGKRVVYVLRDGQPQMVLIEIGASSDAFSELIAGDVQEGDLLVLNPPVEWVPGRPPFGN